MAPADLSREQYNIGSLADLWLNCLDALGDLLEGQPERQKRPGLTSLQIWHGLDAEDTLRSAASNGQSSLTDALYFCSTTSTSFSRTA